MATGRMDAGGARSTRALRRVAAVVTTRRLTVWGTGLLALTWSLYVQAMATSGYVDREGRFKGTDFIQFYVMGSLVLEGRTSALYDGEAHLAAGRQRIGSGLMLFAQHPNYPPQVAALFAPFALLPFGWSLALFLCLSAGAYALAVWLVWKDCAGLEGKGRVVFLLAAAAPAFLSAVRYAQLSSFTLLLFAAALAALRWDRRFAAGLAIGCLAFKPQLGMVIGAAMVIAREWRIVFGALATASAQMLAGWLIAGTAGLVAYAEVLWRLMLDPRLVQIHPSEVHSVRGFLQLLVPSAPVVSLAAALALAVAVWFARRAWAADAPVDVRWGQLVLLTILASPHLLTYDLVLVALPLLAFAAWSRRVGAGRRRDAIVVLLVLLYLAPFSSNIARMVQVQLSVLVMGALAWSIARVLDGAGPGPGRKVRPGRAQRAGWRRREPPSEALSARSPASRSASPRAPLSTGSPSAWFHRVQWER